MNHDSDPLNENRGCFAAFILLIVAIGIVVAFDFSNCFHDSGYKTATCIVSRSMTG